MHYLAYNREPAAHKVFPSFAGNLYNLGSDLKIRIGYVLKSADVGTLFFGRNSENSSHTHAHIHAYPHTPVHTHAHQRTPMHTSAIPPTPADTLAHPHTPIYTNAQSHTPHTYPLMPADNLNLINHIKLHVNGKIAER